jgi:hypothetical protein
MKTNQNLKNKFKILELVRKHFSYTEESLKLFKYRLFYEPVIAPEYFSIVKDCPDLRKRIKIDPLLYEDMDEGWAYFKQTFKYFVKETEMNYADFRNNKIKINKNEIKIKKAIETFYLEHPNFIIKETAGYYVGSILVSKKTKKGYCLTTVTPYENTNCNGCSENCLIKYYEDKKEKNVEITFVTEQAKEVLRAIITRKMDEVGYRKLPAKEMYMVFSLNFADWFLCSTAEKWSSCISLESSYERVFWSGLPNLIGDKNRALLYITTGEQKEYNGIKVDKIIERSWVTLIRSKSGESKNKTFMMFVREYPGKMGLESFAEKILNLKFVDYDFGSDFVGRYNFEMLWHKVTKDKELFNSIYFDNFNVKVAHKNLATFFKSGTFGRYVQGGGNTCLVRKNDKVKVSESGLFYEGGLSRLIHGKVRKHEDSKNKITEVANFYEGNENYECYYDREDGYGEENEEEDF